MRRISFINFCCDIRIHFFQARDLELCIYFWSSANSFCRIWKVRLDSEHATKVSTKNLYFECNGATIAVADGVNDSANGGFRFSFQRNFPFKSDNLNLVVKSQNRKMKNQQILRRDQNETFRESHSSRNFTESFPRIANCDSHQDWRFEKGFERNFSRIFNFNFQPSTYLNKHIFVIN